MLGLWGIRPKVENENSQRTEVLVFVMEVLTPHPPQLLFFWSLQRSVSFQQTCDFQSNERTPDSYQKPHQMQLIRQTVSPAV